MSQPTTVFLAATPTVSSFSVVADEIILKGKSDIIFDFDNVVESTYGAVKAYIDLGDGTSTYTIDYDLVKNYINSDLTLKIAEFGKLNNILNDIRHTYLPSASTYFTSLTASFNITFSNFTKVTIYVPIKIAQSSYYSAIGRLNLLETQMIDVSSNKIFAVLQNDNGDVFNALLSNDS